MILKNLDRKLKLSNDDKPTENKKVELIFYSGNFKIRQQILSNKFNSIKPKIKFYISNHTNINIQSTSEPLLFYLLSQCKKASSSLSLTKSNTSTLSTSCILRATFSPKECKT